jgi:hypothetical protein
VIGTHSISLSWKKNNSIPNLSTITAIVLVHLLIEEEEHRQTDRQTHVQNILRSLIWPRVSTCLIDFGCVFLSEISEVLIVHQTSTTRAEKSGINFIKFCTQIAQTEKYWKLKSTMPLRQPIPMKKTVP